MDQVLNKGPRRWRWQLSIRMLLAVTAVIAGGLAIFRWPWVETSEQAGFVGTPQPFDSLISGSLQFQVESTAVTIQRRTTYRRNWRGQAIKNGVEQTWWEGKLRNEAHFYDGELHGPRRVFGNDGLLTVEAHYRDGRLQGPFRGGDGTNWVWEGNFHDGEMQGAWRALLARQTSMALPAPSIDTYFQPEGFPFNANAWLKMPDDPIVVESHWDRGQRHGRWTIKSVAGEVLNVAEYEQNELVRWNGEPIVEQFREWLTSPEVNEPQLAELLFARYQTVEFQFDNTEPMLGGLTHDHHVKLTPHDQPLIDLIIHFQPQRIPVPWIDYLRQLDEAAPGPALCELAAIQGYGFQYRYGGLWIVLRADPEPPFVDPTGVAQIEFPPGSQEMHDWNEKIDVLEWNETIAGCVGLLLGNTSLKYDLDPIIGPYDPEGFDLLHWQPFSDTPPKEIVFRRTRRDALGLVLFRTGCRCELREGKLVILPREGRTEEERRVQPLSNEPAVGLLFNYRWRP